MGFMRLLERQVRMSTLKEFVSSTSKFTIRMVANASQYPDGEAAASSVSDAMSIEPAIGCLHPNPTGFSRLVALHLGFVVDFPSQYQGTSPNDFLWQKE